MVECDRCERRTPPTKLVVPAEHQWLQNVLCTPCFEDVRENLRVRWINDHYDTNLRIPNSTMGERQERRRGVSTGAP